MKNSFSLILLFLIKMNAWSQIGLPIQQSILPKNSLVVNYDFSKSLSFVRGGSTVTNSTGLGIANVIGSPNFFNSLGFISLNGTSQYLMTTNLRSLFKAVNATVQKSFTMSLWIFPRALNGVIVSEHESQTLNSGFFTSNIELVNGIIKYKVWDGTPINSSSITLNQWYHIAMVYDGASVKGYLNGVLQGTQTYERTIPPSGQNYSVGAPSITNMGSGLNGNFDLAQFKLYQLPLSNSDILQEYNLRKDEFDYTIHSPSTNTNPTYWSVSSVWAGDVFGSLHYIPWLNSNLGWAAQSIGSDLSANEWITLNYDEPAFIKGVVIQPRASSGNQFVTKVHVETSLTGSAPWIRVVSNIPISTTITDDARVLFSTPVFAKSVKVIPVTWTNHIAMRLGSFVKPNDFTSSNVVLRLDAANLKSYSSGTTWTDLSGNGNHATLQNGPTFTADAGGQIVMDGINDYANTSTALSSTSGNNSRTVVVWYKSTANRNTILIDKGSVFDDAAEQLFIASSNGIGGSPPINTGGIYVAFWGNDIYYPILSSTLFDGSWHFVAYTYDNSTTSVRICFDGTFASSVYQWNTSWTTNNSKPFVLPNAINTTNNPLWIGQARAELWGMGGLNANASIPYLYIYNRALTESEILTNYNATRTRYGK